MGGLYATDPTFCGCGGGYFVRPQSRPHFVRSISPGHAGADNARGLKIGDCFPELHRRYSWWNLARGLLLIEIFSLTLAFLMDFLNCLHSLDLTQLDYLHHTL